MVSQRSLILGSSLENRNLRPPLAFTFESHREPIALLPSRLPPALRPPLCASTNPHGPGPSWGHLPPLPRLRGCPERFAFAAREDRTASGQAGTAREEDGKNGGDVDEGLTTFRTRSRWSEKSALQRHMQSSRDVMRNRRFHIFTYVHPEMCIKERTSLGYLLILPSGAAKDRHVARRKDRPSGSKA